MSSLTVNAGNENIVVLNDNYQYDASTSAQTTNAKWLDLSNVVSVKRDKTIYAIRARNSYSFSPNLSQTYYFSNTTNAYSLKQNGNTLQYEPGQKFNSNIYANFVTSSSSPTVQNLNFFMSGFSAVYGNVAKISSETDTTPMSQIGICGSLNNTNFAYNSTVQDGNINMGSSVVILGNLNDAVISSFNGLAFSSNISGNVLNFVSASAGNANIDANGTCFQQVSYSKWNRLINANIGGNVLINASTDPCDLNGRAVNNLLSSVSGNALTNEAFRHQFKLRANTQTASTNNPIYIARVSRFGKSLSDNLQGNLSSKVSVHSFTSNFFASMPSDNQIYANVNLLTGINVSGNLTQPGQVVFNSNFFSGNLYTGTGQFNGNRTDNLTGANISQNNSRFLTIASIPGGPADYITGSGSLLTVNGDINPTGTFVEGDVFTFVQANAYLNQGYLLMDRITLSTPNANLVLASNTFSGQNYDPNQNGLNDSSNYSNLWISANLATNYNNEISAKYIQITGANIVANNWQSTPLITPNTIPTASMIPFSGYEIGDKLNLYLRRGNITFNNYSYVQNQPISPGVPYQPVNVPGFITSMQWGVNGDITLNSNILENGTSMTTYATGTAALPIVTGANAALSTSVACNYQLVVSGNVSEQSRTNYASNVVNTLNFANSFIANAWCYGNTQSDYIGFSGISSNVSIVYAGNQIINGVNIRGLDLNSADAQALPQYMLKFGNTVGSTNAESTLTNNNFTFFANTFANGEYNANITITSPNLVLNNNNHLANLLINDVAFSTYNLGTNSLKFTDITGVLNLDYTATTGNISYSYYLPEAITNSDNITTDLSYKSSSDTFINIIADYNIFNALPGAPTDVHQVSLYDFKYRYGIHSIQSQSAQSSYIPKSIFINGNTFDPSTNFLVNNNQSGVNRILKGNMEAPAISLYTYENVNAQMNYDLAYPFCLPNSNGALPAGGVLFPGWTATVSSGTYLYSGNQTNVNFKIPTNTNVAQHMSLKIHSQNNTTSSTPYMVCTLTIGTQSQPATIPITPVVHGKGPDGTLRYATPILCGVVPNPVSNYYTDYVILMVELVNNSGGGIVPELINSTTTIEILPLTADNQQQIRFHASLRSFPANSAVPLESSVVNNHWSFLTPCFKLASSYDNAAPASSLQAEVYRQPSNQSIISYVYYANVAQELMSYTRTDYALHGALSGYTELPSVTSFASSVKNSQFSSQPDTINPSLPMRPSNSSRFYLDSVNSPVYVDVSNTNNSNTPLGVLNVCRSIEWTLYKDQNLVGRGLISKNSSSTPSITNGTLNTYMVYENMTSLSSGFAMSINTNLTNLASRILLQQITTNVNAQSPTQWIIKTKPDQLNLTVIRMSSSTSPTYYSGSNISSNFIKSQSLDLTTTNSSYDLGAALGGLGNANKFISITIKPVRGFGYNAGLFPLLNNAISTSVFTINIQPDSYAVVWVQPTLNATTSGSVVNGTNVLFSENNNVQGVQTFDFVLSFANRTLAAQYSSTPTVSTTTFNLIANYVYMGYGQVSYVINEFQANYNTRLTSLSLKSGTRNPFGPQTNDADNYAAWKVPAASGTPTITNIKYSSTRQKYYFEIGPTTSSFKDTVYFKGTGTTNIPSYFNNSTTLLLYTGLRPLVMNALTVANSSSTLEDVITSAGLFRWNPNVQNIFTSINSADSVSDRGGNVSRQLYQIVLTNAQTNNGFLFRSAQYTPSSDWYIPNQPNKNFFGSYVSSSEIFKNLKLNISRSTGTITYDIAAQLDQYKYVNPQSSDAVLKAFTESKNNANQVDNVEISYVVSGTGNNSNLGRLFNLNIVNAINTSTPNFIINFNQAQMTVYAANDTNNNGEIDEFYPTNIPSLSANGITTNFGLSNMFSELMFNLPVTSPQSNKSPIPIASWQLNRNYNSIPGSPFDIQMNNMWSVGYNLDCVFTLQNNNCVQFDVITVATKLTTNASGQVLSGLVVNNTAPLIAKSPTDWVRSLVSSSPANQFNAGEKSGLAFKLNPSNVNNLIQAGSIVRLFVDNVINNNWIEWNVKTATLPATGKSFKINLYDQERYAALLDEQLNIVNNFI